MHVAAKEIDASRSIRLANAILGFTFITSSVPLHNYMIGMVEAYVAQLLQFYCEDFRSEAGECRSKRAN
jgi:hypothetical protein